MSKFILLCVALLVGSMGTYTISFGLGVWLHESTSMVTRISWLYQATVVPALLAAPVTGVLVDRWGATKALRVGLLGSGLSPITLLLLYQLEALHFGALLAVTTLATLFVSLYSSAQALAMTILVPKEQLGRANGVQQLVIALVQLGSPALGGLLFSRFGLGGILLMGVITFVPALVLTLTVSVPRVPQEQQAQQPPHMLDEMKQGWHYIRERPGLIGLLVVGAMAFFNLGMLQLLSVPLVMGFSDAQGLGTVMSVAGVGMMLGGVLMTAWGGPQRRAQATLGFLLLQGLLLLLGVAQPSIVLVSAGAFGIMGSLTMVVACNQVIWQRKVPIALQGRVLAVRRLVTQAALPLAYGIAGPLADRVFEPMMQEGGALASSFGAMVGVGKGRGVALLLAMLGVLTLVVVIAGALYPRLRQVEEDLPDVTPLPTPASDVPAVAVQGSS